MRSGLAFVGVVAAILLATRMLFSAGWSHPPVHVAQTGYRGTGMEQVTTPKQDAALKLANVLPDAIDKASPDGKRAGEVYKNVKVLNDLSEEQFNRVMLAFAAWVAPQDGDNAGCAYCHNVENMADDGLYTKVVARRMIQMTRHINKDWTPHVAATGVTCYTCHRGMPVPANIWFNEPGAPHAGGFAATNDGMGHPTAANGHTALPYDPFTSLLEGKGAIRVAATQALPGAYGETIQDTERTYSLMIHMSESLGVNCTFCHNSRAFAQWPESNPARVTAWHGIQMVRDLNVAYLDPLKPTWPANRLGALGDAPKLNCATCHQGANKPLLGVSMAKDYPELGGQAAK